MGQSRVRTRRS